VSAYLVDTDWIIDVLHGSADAEETLLDLAPEGLAVSLITYGELYEGAHYARDSRPALAGLRTFLDGKELLPLTVEVMERFAILRGQLSRQVRQQVGDMDPLIAATALSHDLTLLTRNLRVFRLVPDLILYGEPDEASP
jgi:tRNA(fMet)-specific endonuclease VapC